MARQLGRLMLGLGALASALVIAGCSGVAGAGEPQAATPLDALRGTWTCLQNADPGFDGATSAWEFTITEDSISIDNPDSGMQAEESYELDGSTLIITDADEEWMRLQQGYEEPASVDLPEAVPADGEGFPTAINLPNGDVWALDVAKVGDLYTIAVAEPQGEAWVCGAGDEVPSADALPGAVAQEASEEPEAPATFDTSTALGWCQSALTESGVLDLLSSANIVGSAFISNQGNETLGFTWDCTYNASGTGGAANTGFHPAAWGDPAETIANVLEPMNPLFTAEPRTWNGSQPGAVQYGTPTGGAPTVSGGAEITASDGSAGALTLSIYFGDGTSETVVPTAISAMEAYFGFAATNPPVPDTDGPAHSD